MKKRLLYLILSLTIIANFTFGQNNLAENKKLLIGKWEYNIAYDTIAVANYGNKETDNFFFTNLKISKNKISISGLTGKWNGKWELTNNNEFLILLDNKKTLKYFITKLNKKDLELQSFGVPIPTLGYKRK